VEQHDPADLEMRRSRIDGGTPGAQLEFGIDQGIRDQSGWHVDVGVRPVHTVSKEEIVRDHRSAGRVLQSDVGRFDEQIIENDQISTARKTAVVLAEGVIRDGHALIERGTLRIFESIPAAHHSDTRFLVSFKDIAINDDLSRSQRVVIDQRDTVLKILGDPVSANRDGIGGIWKADQIV
jgi:hypothetical protein